MIQIHCDDCGTAEGVYALSIGIRKIGKSAKLRTRKAGDYCIACALKRFPFLTRRSMTRSSRKITSIA